jgi:hypothetical protein
MGENAMTANAVVNGTSIPFAADGEAQDVAALLTAAVQAISAEGAKAAAAARDKPLFFPNGIELILLQFKIGDKINITLKISGAACCKDDGKEPGQGTDSTALPRELPAPAQAA